MVTDGSHACALGSDAIRSGALYCWGNYESGELGFGLPADIEPTIPNALDGPSWSHAPVAVDLGPDR